MKKIFVWIGLVFGFVSAFPGIVWPAVYNFYFNNTEQGANSTANPQLSVTDGKVEKSEKGDGKNPLVSAPPGANVNVNGTPTTPGQNPPATNPPAATQNAQTAATSEATAAPAEHHPVNLKGKFRLGLGGIYLPSSQLLVDRTEEGGVQKWNTDSTAKGLALNAAITPAWWIGLNAFGGAYKKSSGSETKPKMFYGGELELMPLRLSLGGIEDLVQAGAIVGASSLVNPLYDKDRDNSLAFHTGARVLVNFGKTVSLVGTARLDFLHRSFSMYEAGLGFRI